VNIQKKEAWKKGQDCGNTCFCILLCFGDECGNMNRNLKGGKMDEDPEERRLAALEVLKFEIRKQVIKLQDLQREYRSLTGKNYVTFRPFL